MNEEKEEVTLLDLIGYHESGPVLKERPPDVIRTPSHPEEMVYNYSDDAPPSGKKLTRKKRVSKMRKKALGLTDIPGGSPDGAQGYRPRSSYEQQDFEVSHKSGFGGPSVVDVEEDKPPSNISRTQKRKPINNPIKTELENFFSFLETGRLKRRRASNMRAKMNKDKTELEKLALALRKSGHIKQAEVVTELAMSKNASSSGRALRCIRNTDINGHHARLSSLKEDLVSSNLELAGWGDMSNFPADPPSAANPQNHGYPSVLANTLKRQIWAKFIIMASGRTEASIEALVHGPTGNTSSVTTIEAAALKSSVQSLRMTSDIAGALNDLFGEKFSDATDPQKAEFSESVFQAGDWAGMMQKADRVIELERLGGCGGGGPSAGAPSSAIDPATYAGLTADNQQAFRTWVNGNERAKDIANRAIVAAEFGTQAKHKRLDATGNFNKYVQTAFAARIGETSTTLGRYWLTNVLNQADPTPAPIGEQGPQASPATGPTQIELRAWLTGLIGDPPFTDSDLQKRRLITNDSGSYGVTLQDGRGVITNEPMFQSLLGDAALGGLYTADKEAFIDRASGDKPEVSSPTLENPTRMIPDPNWATSTTEEAMRYRLARGQAERQWQAFLRSAGNTGNTGNTGNAGGPDAGGNNVTSPGFLSAVNTWWKTEDNNLWLNKQDFELLARVPATPTNITTLMSAWNNQDIKALVEGTAADGAIPLKFNGEDKTLVALIDVGDKDKYELGNGYTTPAEGNALIEAIGSDLGDEQKKRVREMLTWQESGVRGGRRFFGRGDGTGGGFFGAWRQGGNEEESWSNYRDAQTALRQHRAANPLSQASDGLLDSQASARELRLRKIRKKAV